MSAETRILDQLLNCVCRNFLPADGDETLPNRYRHPVLYRRRNRDDETVIKSRLRFANGCSTQHLAGDKPGENARQIHVPEHFDVPSGRLDAPPKRCSGVAPKMLEGSVERPKNGRHRWNKQQHCSTGPGLLPGFSKKFVVALDMLEDINRHEGIGQARWCVPEVALYR